MKVHAEKHAPSSDSDRSKLRLGNFVIGKLAGGDCLYQRRRSLIRYMVGGRGVSIAHVPLEVMLSHTSPLVIKIF